ncbi:hypothetical protein B0T25DRAFT_545777 [Lasiosphaeria hispida]|uniref:Mitochondrial intermembrane space import and assembly protein 40 n=1 Tax=Lasiosphaeria hispida TaxID=260671 RepID=A0AAJ0HKA0_9PEZI|nr:hypothetical protein B0T25DRAFT_545777 [Lasiosphaeria hispida]
MYRPALRSSSSALRAVRPANLASSRRFLSTSPAATKRTWKGAGLRWGLAIAAVYFYNTNPIFADELPPQTVPAPSPFSDSDLPTVEALIEEKRRQAVAAAPPPPPPQATEELTAPTATDETAEALGVAAPVPGSPEALEAEAGQQGAFNPETGEINWDCPCLGGMADGPCGVEFKAAFSCFVYSKEEPKGIECIDKFQHMQDCFRQYPEIYGSELSEDDEENTAVNPELGVANAAESPSAMEIPAAQVDAAAPAKSSTPAAETEKDTLSQRLEKGIEEAVPTGAHDATKANDSTKQ